MSAEEIIEDYANKVLSDNDEHTADELIEEIFRIWTNLKKLSERFFLMDV